MEESTEELDLSDLDAGMTPDNALYFLDELFDFLQSEEARSNEKLAELIAMADKMLKDKSMIKKSWLYIVVWVILLAWGAKVLLF